MTQTTFSSASPAIAPHVLLVDDYDDSRQMYATFLSSIAGYRVTEAASGHDALQVLERDRPDVVVLDLVLPDIDGIEVCNEVKRGRLAEETAVVVVTGLAPLSRANQLRLDHAGPDRVLLKPCVPETLLGEIRGVLQHNELVRERSSEEREPSLAIRERSDALVRHAEWLHARVRMQSDRAGFIRLLKRIRGEYNEMPDLALTVDQAQRLFTLSGEEALDALEWMAAVGFLRRNPRGAFIRRRG